CEKKLHSTHSEHLKRHSRDPRSTRATWKEHNMKGILWVIVLLVISPSLYADSIPVFNITSATILFTVNSGSGDNASFGLSGPGTVVFGEGSAGCNWCFAVTIFQQGQFLDGSVRFVGVDVLVSIQLGGQLLDVNSSTHERRSL